MKCLLASFLICTPLWADFREEYQTAIEKGNPEATGRMLDRSREKERDNPDYYALASKFWWEQASQLNLSTKPAREGDTSLVDPQTGREVGSITTAGTHNPELAHKALLLTSQGFRRFPERLDLGFGLAWVQFQSGKKDDAIGTILSILRTAKEKPNGLKWTANAPLPKPAATFIPESIHGYTASLFQAKTAHDDSLCRQLCHATIDVFPEHPYAYNMLAALADAAGNKAEALRFLKIAHEKAPNDTLILLNLAEAYRSEKLNQQAIAAYRKLLTLEIDEDTRSAALEALKELAGPTN